MKSKQILYGVIASTLIFSNSVSVFAKDNSIDNLNNEEITLNYNNTEFNTEFNTNIGNNFERQSFRVGEADIFVDITDGIEISEDDIRIIIDSNHLENGDVITIHGVGYNSDLYDNIENNKESRVIYRYETRQNGFGRPREMDDVFITSVARGQTITLSRQFSRTLGVDIGTGDKPWVLDGNLSRTVTSTVTTSEQFQGPANNSSHNTREFRVSFIGNPGSFVQTRTNTITGSTDEIRFNATVPSHYVRYSIDRQW